jgi:restriction endonuclease Mrr
LGATRFGAPAISPIKISHCGEGSFPAYSIIELSAPSAISVKLCDFQEFLAPEEHSNQETLKSLAEQFHLTDEELTQLLPSGLQPLFTNRIARAKSHLKAVGLIESPRRGFYKIRTRGLEVLRTNPSRVDLRVLNQFPGICRISYAEERSRRAEIGKHPAKCVRD